MEPVIAIILHYNGINETYFDNIWWAGKRVCALELEGKKVRVEQRMFYKDEAVAS